MSRRSLGKTVPPSVRCVCQRQFASAGSHERVASAIEQCDDAFLLVKLFGAFAKTGFARASASAAPGRRMAPAPESWLPLRKSCSVIRRTIGPSSMATGRAGCVSTIFPASLPRYFSKSRSESICTRTTSAVTTPLVPGVHDAGTPMIGCTCGSIMCALKRTSDQPLPNGHDSRCGFDRPHSVNFLITHSLACMMPGPPVRRGP